jgi:hypothetical protein
MTRRERMREWLKVDNISYKEDIVMRNSTY